MKMHLWILVGCYIMLGAFVSGLSSVQKLTGQWFRSNDKIDTLSLQSTIQDTLDMFRKLKTLPPCNQIASASLLHKCASLEGDAGSMLDDVKVVYAIRLAVCELVDAQIEVPSACAAHKPMPTLVKNSDLKGFLARDDRTESTIHYPFFVESSAGQQTGGCMQQLHSKPQFWTSFSNSKQNALTMCHAMRAPVEKDEIIKTYIKMANISVQAVDALNQATESYCETTDRLQVLNTEMQEFRKTTQDSIAHFNHELREQMAATAKHWTEKLEKAVTNSAASAFRHMKFWQSSASQAYTEHMKQAHELAETHRSVALEAHQAELVKYQGNFAELDNKLVGASRKVDDMEEKMNITQAHIATVYDGLNSLSSFATLFQHVGEVVPIIVVAGTLFVVTTPVAHVLLVKLTTLGRQAVGAIAIGFGIASTLGPICCYTYYRADGAMPTRLNYFMLGSALTTVVFIASAVFLALLPLKRKEPILDQARAQELYKPDHMFWHEPDRLGSDKADSSLDVAL